MECPKCATQNPENAVVCSLCSHILKGKEKPAVAVAEPLPTKASGEEEPGGYGGIAALILIGGILAALGFKTLFITYFMVLIVFFVFRFKNAD